MVTVIAIRAGLRDECVRRADEAVLLDTSMTTMLDYQLTLRYLAYLGFEGDTTTAIKVTRPRKLDRRKGKVQRNVFLCYVFGAPRSGKVGFMDTRSMSVSH